jgi:8-oxo-dGTP pyrophosphatase MutT (NUDIX family)
MSSQDDSSALSLTHSQHARREIPTLESAVNGPTSGSGYAATTKPFQVSEQLTSLNIPISQYLREHKDVHILAAGALVFHHDRLLLIQRSEMEKGFRNCWEIPGGQCDDEDETILHSAARELLEETGLHVARLNYQVGENTRFQTGSGKRPRIWQKFSFVVDVVEAGPNPRKPTPVQVKLDPIEHQNHVWVTQADVKRYRTKRTQLMFTSEDQRNLMLEAFARRKAEKEARQSARKAPITAARANDEDDESEDSDEDEESVSEDDALQESGNFEAAVGVQVQTGIPLRPKKSELLVELP